MKRYTLTDYGPVESDTGEWCRFEDVPKWQPISEYDKKTHGAGILIETDGGDVGEAFHYRDEPLMFLWANGGEILDPVVRFMPMPEPPR